MANEIDEKDAYKREPVGTARPSGGGAGEQASRQGDAPTGARAEPASAADRKRRTDHTPPPITFEAGSLTIETDLPITHNAVGGPDRPHHHTFSQPRPILCLKILNDSGTALLDTDEADGMSISIWWKDPPTGEPQIFIDAATLTIEADVPLLNPVGIERPPRPKGNPPTQRRHRYAHPAGRNRGIERVRVVKNQQLVFDKTERLDRVMIWDTAHPPE